MSFLEIALAHAALGYHVFPCVPGEKQPLTKHGHLDATTDEVQIRQWWTKTPKANVGIACGPSGLAVLDVDNGLADWTDFLRWRQAAGLPETYTVRTGRRPGFGVQMYFRGPMAGVRLFNLHGCSGQVKSADGYVMAAGCLHPSGETYQGLCDLATVDTPDVVRGLKTIRPERKAAGEFEKIPEGGGRHAELFSRVGMLRNAGLGEDEMLTALISINEDICAVPVHLDDLKYMAHRGMQYDVPAPDPVVLIGRKQPAETEEPPVLASKSQHPTYPDAVWDGTLFGDFADIVTRDNGIPKKFASESLRVLTGALCGGQVTCGIAGVVMREYLAVIGLRQSGKSWGKDCAVWLYTRQSKNFMFEPMLFSCGGHYQPLRIGAQQFLPGSPNSFVDELTREERKNTPKKDAKIEIKIDARWEPTARYITIQGEAMSLFARFGNDWNGLALAALITDLYDGTDTEVPITKERGAPKMPIRVQYSMMLYTQPLIWKKYMSEQSMDSGLFGRFYIIGSEQKPPQATLPDYAQDPELFQEHFGQVRRELFSRLHYLADHPLKMTVDPLAKKKVSAWLETIGEEEDGIDRASRMGLHVYRAAMARAWGATKPRTEITEEDADAAIQLGIYQVKQREFYAPILGDNPKAKALNLVRQTIRRNGQTTLRALKKDVHAERFSEQFEWALIWLEKRGEILVTDGKRKDQKVIAWVVK